MKIATLYKNRYAKERGAIKKNWGGKISVGLIYPNYYRIGMSNLGFQVIYGILNENPTIVAERVFLPEQEELSLLKKTNSALISVESQKPLRQFDVLAFSLSFENDYPNILTILDLGNIPILSHKREEGYPLIIAGGVTTFMNPEPLADFIDCFLLGEGEVIVSQFFETYRNFHLANGKKTKALTILASQVEGVYCPSFYKVTYKENGSIGSFTPSISSIPAKVKAVKRIPFTGPLCQSKILTPSTEFADTHLVELNRGCGFGCRFCAAGYVYRPPRIMNEKTMVSSLKSMVDEHTRIGLISPSATDIPWIEGLTGSILEEGGDFSLSSFRAGSLTEDLLENIEESSQKTLTFAPEAGSERLRMVINKKLKTREIVDAVVRIAKTGFFHIKLYFIIGLPTETLKDVKDIVRLVKSIRHHIIKESKDRKRIGRIKLSINSFVPKPFTPFQWFPMDTVDSLKEKQKMIKRALLGEGGIEVGFDVPKWAYVQTLLSMGDRRVGQMLFNTHMKNGDWKRTFRSSNLNPDFFVYRPKGLTEQLPWDFIDHGITKSYLKEEYHLALQGIESPPCHVGNCTRCGVCD